MKYSDAVSSQGAELTKAQSQAQESGDTVEAASKQIEEEKKRAAVMRLDRGVLSIAATEYR